MTETPTRYAQVTGPGITEAAVAAYLPAGYEVTGSVETARGDQPGGLCVLIEGKDNAGWTLEDYVIPRLASGNYFATERGAP